LTGGRRLLRATLHRLLLLSGRRVGRCLLRLAAAAVLATAVPAAAQTFYVDDGYRAGPGYGYRDWGGARAEVYVGAPGPRVYAYESAPRYRYSRDWDGGYSAYAYSDRYRYSRGRDDGYSAYAYGEGPYLGYRPYRRWGGPYVGVGVGW
jgi:hypothetical protein